MPCDTRREITLKFDAADKSILSAGLKAAGWRVAVTDVFGSLTITAVNQRFQTISIRDGEITTDERQQHLVDEVKRAYSEQAAMVAAQTFGFDVSDIVVDNNTGLKTFKLARRIY